jgi:hypothetical protein
MTVLCRGDTADESSATPTSTLAKLACLTIRSTRPTRMEARSTPSSSRETSELLLSIRVDQADIVSAAPTVYIAMDQPRSA